MSLTQGIQLVTKTVLLKLWYCWPLHDLGLTKMVHAHLMVKLVFGQFQKRLLPNEQVGTGQRVQSSWNLSQWTGKGAGSFLSMKYFLQYKGSFLERIGMSLSNRMTQKCISEITAKILAAGATGTWNITIWTQPARSPDLNINDLAFFHALQSDYWELGFSKNYLRTASNRVGYPWLEWWIR